MKVFNKEYGYMFICDRCKYPAGFNMDERKALKMARETAKEEGWIWKHPGWKLYCHSCKQVTK